MRTPWPSWSRPPWSGKDDGALIRQPADGILPPACNSRPCPGQYNGLSNPCKTLPLLIAAALGATSRLAPGRARDGVDVGQARRHKLVPADQLEKGFHPAIQPVGAAGGSPGALAPVRPSPARTPARHRPPHPAPSHLVHPRAERWQWEVNLIGSGTRAFCVPGGKIAFYTGLIDGLKLTDDDVAMGYGPRTVAHSAPGSGWPDN